MAATQRQLAEALYEMLVGVPEHKQNEVIVSFISEIRSRGLLTDGERFMRAFESILYNLEDKERLHVTLAHGMTVPGAETEVDTTLIAGAIAERGGRRADATVFGRLRMIQRRLSPKRA